MPQFNNDVLPDVEGRKLGIPDQRYDAFLRDLNVSGDIIGTFSALAINRLTRSIIAFSANPIFPATQGTAFEITLTGDVVSSSITGLIAGALYAFLIKQDTTGGRTFVWPVNVSGGADIGTESLERTAQLFYSDGDNLYALTPGVIQ